MEIPLEQQQVLTLTQTMHTNVFPTLSIVQDHMIDVCVCLTTVPVLPRPALSRVLTLLNFAQAAGPLSSLPARNHLTAVFKSHCQETSVCVCVCVRLSVYTFASMILVFATSRGVVTNAATAPTKDTCKHLANIKGPLSALRRVFTY